MLLLLLLLLRCSYCTLPQARPADCLQWVPTSSSQEAWLAAARATMQRGGCGLPSSAEPYGEASCAQQGAWLRCCAVVQDHLQCSANSKRMRVW
jgi:hypothetical protein